MEIPMKRCNEGKDNESDTDPPEVRGVKRQSISHHKDAIPVSKYGKERHMFKLSLNNPLIINGYTIFDNDHRDSSIHNCICKLVRDSMDCTNDPSSVEVVFQIGRILSTTQSRRITLPVETESVLDFDFNKVQFVPEVSADSLDILYMNIFTSKTVDAKLVSLEDYLELELVALSNDKVDGIRHSKIYRISFNCEEGLNLTSMSSFRNNKLDELIIYRPQSHYHYRVFTQSTLVSNETDDETLIKILFRNVRVYKNSRKSDIKCVKFILQVIDQWDVIVNDDISKLSVNELFEGFYNTFINKKKGQLMQCIDVESAEETKVKLVQIAGDNRQLNRQYKRLLEYRVNRFDFILSMLQANTNVILKSFDNQLNGEFVDYYPNLFGDTSEYAQIHYDTRKIVRQHGSAIEALRKHNNFVKRIQIALHVKQFASVLDLACGHGQDLDKYANKRISKLLGIDISFREILEARRRYSSRKENLRFSTEFHHGNILDDKVYNTFVRNQKFDVVSIQLAIHYILQDEKSATYFLEHVHKALNDKGIFIGSTVCCQEIAKFLSDTPVFQSSDGETVWQFGNSIFRITLDGAAVKVLSNDMSDINTAWGLKYHFFLMESIDESEYIVPWKSFVDLAAKIGLRLVESYTFPEYLHMSSGNIENANLHPTVVENLNRHMRVISSIPLSNDQRQVFSLYKIFIFEKITGRDKLYIQGVKIKK